MKLGVVQGRLSKPTHNQIQQFPENWETEFELIEELGLNHIEWLVTAISFAENKLDINAKKYADKITSIGCDNLTNENIDSKDFLDDQLEPVCEFALKNNIKSVTIPLLEKSKIDNFVDKFLQNIEAYSKRYKELSFNFELESIYNIALELCNSQDNFYITYDTGNITACEYNHKEYITKCIEFINTVHLKDKTIEPLANVEPGTGNTNFELIFNTLKECNYDNKFTLQTSRGQTGNEINTIKQHKEFFEDMHAKLF